MYSKAEFAPLSQASLKRLLKGHTVRVKHGSGLQLGLSKMQMKKHMSSKKKGQGGYNMTMDPYQCQMHGEGFFGDIGNAFKQLGNSFVENVAKPIANEVIQEGKSQGRKAASTLIRQGIPFAASSLGGLAGSTLGGLTGNPLGVEAGEVIGQQLGEYGGKKLADYVGKKTGFGMKKRGRPKKGGTLLIDEPLTARQVVNTTGNFFKNPGKTLGFGFEGSLPYDSRKVPPMPTQYKGRGTRMGGTLLIDQPFTARQVVNSTGNFFKDPGGTLGFGLKEDILDNQVIRAIQGRGVGMRMKGGTLLIDEPITARQVVNSTGNFFKNPGKTLGFGIKKRRGGALKQAGY